MFSSFLSSAFGLVSPRVQYTPPRVQYAPLPLQPQPPRAQTPPLPLQQPQTPPQTPRVQYPPQQPQYPPKPQTPSQTQPSSVAPPHKDPCDNPYDTDDLYYYISSQNGEGPYIPVSEKELWNIARKATGNESDQRDYIVYTKWTTGDIPKTNATGCMSQNLGGIFGVRVDGLNKVIIDAYNAKFPNRPPLVPLKTKYFYYIRWKGGKEYLSRSLILINRFGKDHDWKSGKIPNTNATGLMRTARNDNVICVRVDRANNAIIEAYNESLTKPLPPGWEEVQQPSGQIFYGNPALKIVQEIRPTSSAPEPTTSSTASSTSSLPPLPPGWEELTEPSGRIYYGNPTLKTVQYDRPLSPLPPGWEEYKELDGRRSYVYRPLNYSQTERPLPLPPGWEYLMDKSGKLYYMNSSLYKAQYAFPTSSPSTSAPAPAQISASAPPMEDDNTDNMVKPANIEGAPSTASAPSAPSAPPSSTDPSTSKLPPLPHGWEELKEPSGRIYYGNPTLKIVQLDRPSEPPVQLQVQPMPKASSTPSSSPPPSTVPSIPPTVYEINNNDVADYQSLMNKIKSMCPPGTPKCQITLSTNAAAGGSKNKKKHGCRTKRHRKASRRKASRRKARSTSKK